MCEHLPLDAHGGSTQAGVSPSSCPPQAVGRVRAAAETLQQGWGM